MVEPPAGRIRWTQVSVGAYDDVDLSALHVVDGRVRFEIHFSMGE